MSTIRISLFCLLLVVARQGFATEFSFDNQSNQFWTSRGFGDGGSFTLIDGAYDGPAQWTSQYGFPDAPTGVHGAIIAEVSGTVPESPSGIGSIHWDFLSPKLTSDDVWSQATDFRFDFITDLTSNFQASTPPFGSMSVQVIWHAIKNDLTDRYFSDFFFRPVACNTCVERFEIKAPIGLRELPIVHVLLRVFLEPGAEYDGIFGIDNVVPVTSGASVQAALAGDLDLNGRLESFDLDGMDRAIGLGEFEERFDLNSDGLLNPMDRDHWLELADILPGDANTDGIVSMEDFLILSGSFGSPGFWSDGDFDGDHLLAFADFLILSREFGGSRRGAAVVPEPDSSWVLVVLVMVCFDGQRRFGVNQRT